MFCHNCGKEIPANIKFCPHCGTQVITSPPTEPKPESEPESGPTPTTQPQPPSKPSTPSKESKLTFKEVLEGLVALIFLIAIGYNIVKVIKKIFSHFSPPKIVAEEILPHFLSLGYNVKEDFTEDGTHRITIKKEGSGEILTLLGDPQNLKEVNILQLLLRKEEFTQFAFDIIFVLQRCTKDNDLALKIHKWITEQSNLYTEAGADQEKKVSEIFKNLKISLSLFPPPLPSIIISIQPISSQNE
jgi:hypothetical protein